MGVLDRLAGDRALGLGVADLADPATTETRLIETGRSLRDTDGAEVLILGCAGMARYRGHAGAGATDLPVIDPLSGRRCDASRGASRLSPDPPPRRLTCASPSCSTKTARGVFTIAAYALPARRGRWTPKHRRDGRVLRGEGGDRPDHPRDDGRGGQGSSDKESRIVIDRVTARASVPVVVGVSAPGLAGGHHDGQGRDGPRRGRA